MFLQKKVVTPPFFKIIVHNSILELQTLQVFFLKEGVEMVMPGDNAEITVELICPVAMDKGLRFAIREGGRTVGAVCCC